MAQTGVRGTGFKSPRDLTGRIAQELSAKRAKELKAEEDRKNGKTYEAGYRNGYREGWDTGWDAGVQFLIDRLEREEKEAETGTTDEPGND